VQKYKQRKKKERKKDLAYVEIEKNKERKTVLSRKRCSKEVTFYVALYSLIYAGKNMLVSWIIFLLFLGGTQMENNNAEGYNFDLGVCRGLQF
jgi:hypothetical protein